MSFIYGLSIILFGLCFGRGLRFLAEKGKISESIRLPNLLKKCTYLVLLGLNPIILLGAFWGAKLDNIKLYFLPLLGVLTLILGGILAVTFAKIRKLNHQQEGAMFVSGSFSNLGNFGLLFCFLFLGEESIMYVALFRLFEELFYYMVAFPIAKSFGERAKGKAGRDSFLTKVLTDPFIMITLSVVLIGILLNMSALQKPHFFSILNTFLVPLAAFLLVAPIGFNMKLNVINKYIKEGIALCLIKFVVVPIVITSFSYFLGLGEIHNGLVLKVIFLLAAMPSAVSSLIPPQLFQLDIDLANSNWIVNTGVLFLMLPILYFVVHLL